MSESLKGKVVAITGAASGIGLECARTFLVAGATVVIGAADNSVVFDWEPTLTSTAELVTGPRGADARLEGSDRPTRSQRREEYFDRMNAKAQARAELIRERESGIWRDDEGFAVDPEVTAAARGRKHDDDTKAEGTERADDGADH